MPKITAPAEHAARLEFTALRAVHDLAIVAAEASAFTNAQRAVVLAAMKGEVSK